MVWGVWRCIIMTLPDGSKRKFCFVWAQWPTFYLPAYPHSPGPDPGPLVSFSGIDQKLMKELWALDNIQGLLDSLSPKAGKLVRQAVEEGMRQLQEKLPSNITLSVESESQP